MIENSRGQHWQRIRRLEDILAILQDIEERRHFIEARAWATGQGEIYEASEEMERRIKRIKLELSTRWYELMES